MKKDIERIRYVAGHLSALAQYLRDDGILFIDCVDESDEYVRKAIFEIRAVLHDLEVVCKACDDYRNAINQENDNNTKSEIDILIEECDEIYYPVEGVHITNCEELSNAFNQMLVEHVKSKNAMDL